MSPESDSGDRPVPASPSGAASLPAAGSQPARLQVDAFEFARTEGRIGQSTPVAALPRLAGSLRQSGGAVEWSLAGSRGPDPEGRPASWLHLRERFDAPLQCVRCLETVTLPIQVSRRFKLERDQALVDLESLDEDAFDALLGSTRFEVMELVEDEALLALPFAPSHEDCALPGGGIEAGASEAAGAGAGDEERGEPARENPFAKLAALRRGRGSGEDGQGSGEGA